MRTVSLLPSATEFVGAIGAADTLVGRSHRCNYPLGITEVPVVTESRLNNDRTPEPATIDSIVDDHHHGEQSYFSVQTDVLKHLQPDVILTQNLCEVCAVPESMTVRSLDQLNPTPDLISLGPTTIDGIFESIERVGSAIGRDGPAAQVVADLINRIDTIVETIPDAIEPPRVVCLEWVDPLRSHGLWIPDVLRRLGAENPFGTPGERGRKIEWDALLSYDPDVLIVSPCGQTVSEITADMDHLIERPRWSSLSAVQMDRVFILDGELSSRHGPRVVRSLELIASMMYPEQFQQISPKKHELLRYSTETE